MIEPVHDGILGKRRRSGPAESGVLQKRVKFEPQVKHKRKRKRTRTKGVRQFIKDEIEKALQLKNSPIGSLFNSRNEDGEPEALFSDIVKALKLNSMQFSKLTTDAIIRISNLTTLFKIYKSENDLKISYRPPHDTIEACTVYIDNLPAACNAERLDRLLNKFGTVVKVTYPRTPSRLVHVYGHLVEMGKKYRPYAFVQFTERSAVDAIIKEYYDNSKFLTGKRRRNVPNISELKLKLKRLSSKKAKRSRYEYILIARLRKIYRYFLVKERTERKKSLEHKVPETTSRKNNASKSIGTKKADNSVKCGSRKSSSMNAASSVPQKIKKSKKKRKRVHRRRVHAPYYLPCSVADYFKNIQVVTYCQYKQLRNDYLDIRNSSQRVFKNFVNKHDILPHRGNIYRGVIDFRDRAWSHREKDAALVPELRPYISPPAFSCSPGSTCFSLNPFDYRIDFNDLLFRSFSVPPSSTEEFVNPWRKRRCHSEPPKSSLIEHVVSDPPAEKPATPRVDPRLCPRLGSSLTLRSLSEGPILIPLEYSENPNRRNQAAAYSRNYVPLQSRNYSDENINVLRPAPTSRSPPQENRVP